MSREGITKFRNTHDYEMRGFRDVFNCYTVGGWTQNIVKSDRRQFKSWPRGLLRIAIKLPAELRKQICNSRQRSGREAARIAWGSRHDVVRIAKNKIEYNSNMDGSVASSTGKIKQPQNVVCVLLYSRDGPTDIKGR